MSPTRLLEVMEVAPDDPLTELLDDDDIDVRERLALAFGGPAFQWR